MSGLNEKQDLCGRHNGRGRVLKNMLIPFVDINLFS
jgi:hypothetical protein